MVKLPSPEYVNPIISSDPKLFPWFKDALGAIDGTHIQAFVPNTAAQSAWRNRKGFLSQNVFAAVDFHMNFVSVLAGWEGSAHDLMVYKTALEKGFSVPAGKYYLADAGYKSKDSQDLLTPYLKVRYHLKEQAQASCRPETPEELFNLRHAQLRNVVERAFGVLKKRFRILTSIPVGYSLKTQVRIVYALTALHNFYNMNGLDPNLETSFIDDGPEGNQSSSHDDLPQPNGSNEESFIMHHLREVLAYEMFEDYRRVRAARYGDVLQTGIEPWTQPVRY